MIRMTGRVFQYLQEDSKTLIAKLESVPHQLRPRLQSHVWIQRTKQDLMTGKRENWANK